LATRGALEGGMGVSTILVVEDDADIRSALCAILEDEGYRVACAGDGQEALAALRSGVCPAVILLDLMMPVMDGADFRAAQLRDPHLAAIPIVVLTADGRLQDAAQALGAAAAFAKPFELKVLLRALDRLASTPIQTPVPVAAHA
jgi:CheY-like chemotaxis protein